MKVCKALSDQTRYLMVKMLLDENRELCICEFEEFFDKDSSVLYRNMKKPEEKLERSMIGFKEESSEIEDRKNTDALIGSSV